MESSLNLKLSYQEHTAIELEKLKNKLLEEEAIFGDVERWQRHRIFHNNLFQEVDIRTAKRSQNLLCYTLTCLGHYLDQNLVTIGRENGSTIETPTPLRNFSQHESVSSISFLGPDLRQGDSLLLVDRRNKDNYIYDKWGAIHLKSKKHIKWTANKTRQPLMLAIVSRSLKLINSESYVTQRELYYTFEHFCRRKKTLTPPTGSSSQNSATQPSQQSGSQGNTNSEKLVHVTAKLELALNDICCLVGCSKLHLHIIPQTKGLIFGKMLIKLKNGVTIDCSAKKHGTPLPNASLPITTIESDAKFVLLLEKDSVMQKILDQEEKYNFISTFKAVLITGKGYPDSNTRFFINFLWNHLRIPILALTDADPYGVEIVCSYKFGSYTSAYEGPSIVTPQIKWLGLLPSDVTKLSVSKTCPQSEKDLRKINSLLNRPYLLDKDDWREQLMMMRASATKAEIECLGDEFLVTTYLPNKLKYASWL